MNPNADVQVEVRWSKEKREWDVIYQETGYRPTLAYRRRQSQAVEFGRGFCTALAMANSDRKIELLVLDRGGNYTPKGGSFGHDPIGRG